MNLLFLFTRLRNCFAGQYRSSGIWTAWGETREALQVWSMGIASNSLRRHEGATFVQNDSRLSGDGRSDPHGAFEWKSIN